MHGVRLSTKNVIKPFKFLLMAMGLLSKYCVIKQFNVPCLLIVLSHAKESANAIEYQASNLEDRGLTINI